MSTILRCPICGRSHDVITRLSGDVILCPCGEPLLVQHGVGASRVTQLRPDVQSTLWTWLETEIASLWLEIYFNRPDLDERGRLAEADAVNNGPEILMQTLAFAEEWDRAAAAARRLALTERVVLAAWALREVDLWPESAAMVGCEPSEFDSALQRLYAVLQEIPK